VICFWLADSVSGPWFHKRGEDGAARMCGFARKSPKKAKAKIGRRPSDYSEDFCVQVEKLCRLGATDEQIADFFCVHVATIYRWQAT